MHLIVTPSDRDGLWWTFRTVYSHAGDINARMRMTGQLWQGRNESVVMDEGQLDSALRQAALNPVGA